MKIELDESFDIPGSTPQQRGMSKGGNYPRKGLVYARAAWRALMERHRPAEPMQGAVRLSVTLRYHTGDKRKAGNYKTTRPDGTNLLKLIEDCATRAGWWADDSGVQQSMERVWTLDGSSVRIVAETI